MPKVVNKKISRTWNLPSELNEKIFSYLDHDTLKTASSVCKEWRSTIHGTRKLMSGSKLLIKNFKQQKKYLELYGRNFTNVKLLKKEGSSDWTRDELAQTLMAVPNVRDLDVSEKSFRFRKNEATNIPLESLKVLTLHDSANTFRMSQFLQHVNLEELTIKIDGNQKCLDESFMDWFWKQEQLLALNIHEKAAKIFLKLPPIDQIKFQLQRLAIKFDGFGSVAVLDRPEFTNNLLNFLKSQEKLEEICLEVEPFYNISFQEVTAYLFSSKSLKKIQIDGYMSGLPIIGEDNLVLEALIVRNRYWIAHPWNSLLKLKNLKFLEISTRQLKNFFPSAGTNLSQLETLKIEAYEFHHEPDAFKLMDLPNLKELKLTNVMLSLDDWLSITDNCPRIEKISLDKFVLERNSVILISEKLKNLKEFDLGCGIYKPDIFLSLQNSNLKHLKITATAKQHLDVALLGNRSFKITVKNVDHQVDDEHENRYAEFQDGNHYLACLSTFLNNFPDFI